MQNQRTLFPYVLSQSAHDQMPLANRQHAKSTRSEIGGTLSILIHPAANNQWPPVDVRPSSIRAEIILSGVLGHRTTVQQWRRSSTANRNGDVQHVNGPPEEQVLTNSPRAAVAASSTRRRSGLHKGCPSSSSSSPLSQKHVSLAPA